MSVRKTLAASLAGLLLIAGQAVANQSAPDYRVQDRIGARSEQSSNIGVTSLTYTQLAIAFGATLVAVIFYIIEDDGDSN